MRNEGSRGHHLRINPPCPITAVPALDAANNFLGAYLPPPLFFFAQRNFAAAVLRSSNMLPRLLIWRRRWL
jgi:hypothetical protein